MTSHASQVVSCLIVAIFAFGALPGGAAPAEEPYLVEPDDAGSGRDAPNGPDPDFVFEDAKRYRGSLVSTNDSADWYAFVPPEEDMETSVRIWSPTTRCPTVYTPSMEVHPFAQCSPGAFSQWLWFYTDEIGTYYLEFRRLQPVFGVNELMTSGPPVREPFYEFVLDYDFIYPGPIGEGSFVHDDAGSGRDAKGHFGGYVWPDPDAVHVGQLIPVFDDRADWYAVTVDGAKTIQVKLAGPAMACPEVWIQFETMDSVCHRNDDASLLTVTANLVQDGRHHIDIRSAVHVPASTTPGVILTEYRFSYAFDGEAPDPR